MPKNHGRIVSIFSSHKDCCPSFYHSDLHAKFQPIPTGAIREIAQIFFEGRVSFMPKPAGAPTPPPKRALNAYGARPPRGQAFPQGQEFPPVTRTLNFVLLTSHYHSTYRQKTQRNTLTHTPWRSLELQHAGN